MKALQANLLSLLQGAKQFIIPIFQRTYSWEQLQCEQLWRDILRVGEDGKASAHFIGSVVYIHPDLFHLANPVPQLLVIDGQQRLTTLTLLIAALAAAIENSAVEIDTTRRKLENYYLLNAEEDGERRHKLLLTRADRDTLLRIVNGQDLPPNASPHLVENYRYFQERLKDANLAAVYMGLQKLVIVDISLDRVHDDPQLIFESLNSTGLDLSQADLIRNYVLMGQEPQKQTKLYEDHWYPIEQSFGNHYASTFDWFMRDYLTMATRSIPNIREVYRNFKEFVQREPRSGSIKEVVADIHRYAEYYVRMVLLTEPDSALRSAFEDIKTLRVDVAYPFLLEVYHDFVYGKVSRDDFLQVVRLVECYVFRRAVCGVPTNSLNKTFASLTRDIDKTCYLDNLKAKLIPLTSYRRFPADAEFGQALAVKDIYNFRNRNYLFRKLENYDRREWVSIEEYTIEHVLPQNPNLSEIWRQELGPNWKDVQEKYLHSLGNLTLTGYNSPMSDRPFQEKKQMTNGFRDSPLRLNRSLAKAEHWNEEAIVQRAKELAAMALRVWPYPAVPEAVMRRYAKRDARTSEKTYTLADHPYLSGDMLDLFEQLRKRILNLDASVTEEILKLYVAFKTTTNFVDVVPQKSRLRLSLNVRYDQINDLKGLTKDVTSLGRWGNGDVEVGISHPGQLDDVMNLVRQSFELHLDKGEE